MTAIYLMHGDEMLMLYRVGSRVVAPSWCGVGGHFEKDELNDAKAAALREMQEEIGLTENDLENFTFKYATFRLKNNEIRQNYYFFADLKEGTVLPENCNEGTLAWVPLHEVMEKTMPLTAKLMLEHYLSVGRFDQKLYAGVTTADGMTFTELEDFPD